MEVFIADVNGKNVKQVTSFGQANWAPAYMPDSKRIILPAITRAKEVFLLIYIPLMKTEQTLKKYLQKNRLTHSPCSVLMERK